MCGLLGEIYFNKNFSKTSIKKFRFALNLMEHRGPDDQKISIGEKFIFGFQRLSIQDLSKKASQPMFTEDGMYSIMLNGEIYNFKELREDLKNKGFKFFSYSDTEVLLKGMISEGIDFVNKCNGMFSFCFYNKKKNVSYIFRDRVGIKPLYYAKIKNKIIFSSEIPSILFLENELKKLNHQALYSYFSYRYPINNQTFFKEIKSLEPGHLLIIKNEKIITKKYWDISKYFNLKKNYSEGYYIEKLRELVKSAVKYQLISDANVSSLLSGGLDSSILSALASKESGKKFRAYTIGYKNNGYNEFDFAKTLSKKLEIKHSIITASEKNYFKDLDKLVSIKGSPLSIPNEITQYQLCSEIKKNAKVVLAGAGADEIFVVMEEYLILRQNMTFIGLSDILNSTKKRKILS